MSAYDLIRQIADSIKLVNLRFINVKFAHQQKLTEAQMTCLRDNLGTLVHLNFAFCLQIVSTDL